MRQSPFPPARRKVNRRQSPPRRTVEIVSVSFMLALVVLLGLGAILWAVQGNLLPGPTATPTATSAAPVTSTPDFRATRVMEDMLTQVAYNSALTTRVAAGLEIDATATFEQQLLATPASTDPAAVAPSSDVTVSLPIVEAPGSASGVDSPLPTPVQPNTNINLPIVSNGDQPTSVLPTPIQISPLPTPFATPIPVVTLVSIPIVEVVPPTATLPPTFTPTPLPPPTNTPPPAIALSVQQGLVIANTRLYQGPGTRYTFAGELPANTQVTLLGRDSTGEWVYVCCINANSPNWGRQAQIRPRGNALPAGAPASSTPDDVRWLQLGPAPTNLTPQPTGLPTAIPVNDFPMAQRSLSNSSRLPRLPVPPYTVERLPGGAASQPYISSVALLGNNLYVVSADTNIYSIDRTVGNQRWRTPNIPAVRTAPLVVGGNLYLLTEDGTVIALLEQGLGSQELWRRSITRRAAPGVTIKAVGDRLFVGGDDSSGDLLITLDRNSGSITRNQTIGDPLKAFAFGGQLLFLASNQLVALDIDNPDIKVWERTDIANPATAPLYAFPGVRALAELYVVDGAGKLWSLDANTGANVWQTANPDAQGATHLALADNAVIASLGNAVRAFARSDGRLLWSVGLDGPVPGGALTDGTHVLVITASGAVYYIDIASGAVTSGQQRPAAPGGASAVSGNAIYVPGSDGNLYVLRGN